MFSTVPHELWALDAKNMKIYIRFLVFIPDLHSLAKAIHNPFLFHSNPCATLILVSKQLSYHVMIRVKKEHKNIYNSFRN